MELDLFVNNGRRLEYALTGDGYPVVFLHGLGGSIGQMVSAFDLPAGICRITLNQQGHGGSDFVPEIFSFDSMADDVAALLSYLGVAKAGFAGISMGAAVALNMAARYPQFVEKLLLVRNAWTDRPMSGDVTQAYRDLGLALKEKDETAFWRSRGGAIVSATGSLYTKGAFTGPFSEKPQLKNWQKFLLLPPTAPVRDTAKIEAIRVPVMILACRGDFCHPYEYGEYIHGHIPGSVLYEIPGKDVDPAAHRVLSNRYFRELMRQA